MAITLETKVTLSQDALLQEVGGEAVLLDLKSECYFGLDAVGTRIWRLAEQDGRLEAIQAALLNEYDVDPTRLEHDLRDLVTRLAEAGLVKIEATSAT